MFSSNFWESDFVSQNGFDTLVTRAKEGRQTCRDLEEFLKSRAKAEEDFAKILLKIARVERAADESGTLKSSLDVLRREAEAEAGFHFAHSQHLSEEANKLADFREKQREERRRHEEAMHRVNKMKTDSFRRMQSCKSGYESKFRAAEKADSDFERLKFASKAREVDRARKTKQQCRQTADKADDDYQNAVAQLEMARQSWELDHRKTCDIMQRLEEERILYLRNAVWIYSNLGSEQFVRCDESRENIRLSLEKCDPQHDIGDFVSRKATGTRPLSSITYTPCGGSSGNHQATNSGSAAHAVARSAEHTDDSSAYASIDVIGGAKKPMYKAMHDFKPRDEGQIELVQDDRILVTEQGPRGWWEGKNSRTGNQGLFPANYVMPL